MSQYQVDEPDTQYPVDPLVPLEFFASGVQSQQVEGCDFAERSLSIIVT